MVRIIAKLTIVVAFGSPYLRRVNFLKAHLLLIKPYIVLPNSVLAKQKSNN
jgi:hypothetical protein